MKVRGVLFDPYDAVVVGATVYLENQTLKVHSYSDETGTFYFDMPPGIYELRVQARGFKKYVIEKFEVSEGKPQDVTVRLSPNEGATMLFIGPEIQMEKINAPVPEKIGSRKLP